MGFFSYLWETYIEPVYDWVKSFFYQPLTNHPHQVHPEPERKSIAKTTEELRRERNPVRPSKGKCVDCSRICVFLCIHCNTHLCSTHWDDSNQCPLCLKLNTKQYFPECYQKDTCKLNVDAYDCFLGNCKHMYHRKCLDDHFNELVSNGIEVGCFHCTTKFNIDEDVKIQFAKPVVNK
uniref:Uncharacterized protein n=1 Tax=Cacopsylla melanoneura TaxID=428564 RepID=A0A8D9AJK4_9HEMI